MNKKLIGLVATSAILGISVGHADQQAGLRQKVIGVWSLVSQAVEKPDGSRVERFGADPKGIAFFDESGRFAMILVRSDLPKIASNNAMTATDAENKAIIQGSTAFFGSWSVDEATGTMLNRVDGATYPNWDGTDQKRTVSMSGDEMKVCVPSQIGGTSCAVWRRSH
jgi:hypothetical protein